MLLFILNQRAFFVEFNRANTRSRILIRLPFGYVKGTEKINLLDNHYHRTYTYNKTAKNPNRTYFDAKFMGFHSIARGFLIKKTNTHIYSQSHGREPHLFALSPHPNANQTYEKNCFISTKHT